MNPQDTIDQFFVEDGQLTQDQLRVTRSVLLALISDIEFTILLPGKWRRLNLTEEQNKILRDMLPTFTVISQFCSAVDVLARVIKKGRPRRGENGDYFKECAQDSFGMNIIESEQLWLLRNGISHNYRLETQQVANQYGYGRILRQSPNSGLWHFYLHAMYTGLIDAKKSIYRELSGEADREKQATADYLTENGFFYTLAS